MIKNSKNYSVQGFNFEKRFHPKNIKPESLKSILAQKRCPKLIKAKQAHPSIKNLGQNFGNLTSRDRLSSFQLATTGKNQRIENQYELNVQDSQLRRSMPVFSLRKEKDQRLKGLMPSKSFKQRENPQSSKKCFKFEMRSKANSMTLFPTKNEDLLKNYPESSKQIKNNQQLQRSRKSLHNFDFRKQLSRLSIQQPYYQKAKGLLIHFPDKKQLKNKYTKKVGVCKRFAQKHTTSQDECKSSISSQNSLLKKSFSIHDFKSYTARVFLQARVLNKFPNSNKSGENADKIPLSKYKSNVKLISIPKLQSLGRDRRIILRCQRVDKVWNTQLDYSDARDKLKSRILGQLNFKKQISRQPYNSPQKYGSRMCLKKH